MSDDLWELGSSGFSMLLIATWRVLPLLLVAVLADLVIGRRLASKYHALLWSLVVLRLLLPFSLPNPWSLQGPLDQLAGVLGDIPPPPPRATNAYQDEVVYFRANTEPPVAHPISPKTGSAREIDWHAVVFAGALLLWLSVAAGLILRRVAADLRFAWRLRSCRELDDPHFIDILLRQCDSLRIARRPTVKMVPSLSTPALFGLFQSTICLPPNTIESLSEQELIWVLRHELGHLRRRDAWLHWIASLMQAIHWFNPVAWLAIWRLRWHMEGAADELALASASPHEAVGYGRLLLKFAEQASSQPARPSLGFLPMASQSGLQNRIENLTRNRRPRRSWIGWLIALGVTTLAVAGLTDAAGRAEVEHFLNTHNPTGDLSVGLAEPENQGETAIRTYDVAEVLRQIIEIEPTVEPKEYLLQVAGAVTSNREMLIEDGRLIADLSESRHQALARMLEAWRISGPRQLAVEFRVIHADMAWVSGIDWVADGISVIKHSGSQPVAAAKISEDQLREFLVKVQQDPQTNLMLAPKVMLFNGQSATLAMMVQRPFVTGVDQIAEGVFQPLIEVLDEGLRVIVQPAIVQDGTVALTFDLRKTTIDEVRMANLPYGMATPSHRGVTVQVPNMATTSVQSKVSLAVNESVLIAMPDLFDDDEDSERSNSAMFYALTPRLIEPEPR